MLYEHLKPNFVSMVKVVNQSVTKHFQKQKLTNRFPKFYSKCKEKSDSISPCTRNTNLPTGHQ